MEAIILAASEPIAPARIAAVLPSCNPSQVRAIVDELNAEYAEQRRAFEIWEVAGEIGERSLLGRDVFPARAHGIEAAPEAEREIEVGLFELVDAMRRALARGGHTGAAHEVEIETVTVRERILAVMEVLASREAQLATDPVGPERHGMPWRVRGGTNRWSCPGGPM